MPELARDIAAVAKSYRLSERAKDALVSFGQFVINVDDARFVKREWRASPGARIATSLAALELESVQSARRVADVGSGIGFPGLVLAAVLQEAQVTLVEPEAGRCELLRSATAAMRLSNVDVVEGRVESWRQGAGTCDLVTCRGLADLRGMVKKAAPLVGDDGFLVLWGRSRRDAAWESGADAAASARGLTREAVHRTTPPIAKGRFLYVYAKTGP